VSKHNGNGTYVAHPIRRAVRFPTIFADPNWAYDNFGAKKHGAARGHYSGSPVAHICALAPVVQEMSRPDSTLLLWATLPKLDQAIDVMRAWGFHLVTSLPWVKTVPASAELAKGIGFWSYVPAEVLLICRRGHTGAPNYKKGEKPDGLLVGEKGRCVFYARRGAHSRKPLSLIEWTESYLPGPLLELFATGKRPGWTCYGWETGHWIDPTGIYRLKEAQRAGLAPRRQTTKRKKKAGTR